MSTNMRGWFSMGRIAVAFGFLAQSFWPAYGAATGPSITGLRRESTNVVVTVEVPAGLRRVMLESRERVGAGAWVPRAVARLQGEGGSLEFRLPRSRNLELLRIRGDERERLPASFFGGTNDFAVQPAGLGETAALNVAEDTRSGTVADTSATSLAPSGSLVSPGAVVESDIWQICGQTLYFFNQYRGLQVIDLAQPDAPVVTGTLSLPAVGEQMYLLGQNEMVLLARSYCTYRLLATSEVLVVRDTSATPTVLARLPLPGYITESRLVGNVLYVASQDFRQVTNAVTLTNAVELAYPGTTWEWGTVVTAFDLADPEAPVQRGSIWCPGYGDRVAADNRFFYVIQQQPNDWRRSVVQLIDISAGNGTMQQVGEVNPKGQVPDKFKLDLHGDILTVISETRTTNVVAWLETFSLVNPAEPQRLGELNFGSNESLHATRFAGDRVYVVTFHVEFRMDPLWVVDLSDPAHPAIKGQLEIPGWSTYLEPWGNRLVALGIETNRTSLSLFDVADASHPGLLSRVTLGEGWSWSEANQDEKAMKVIPESGLVLVPYGTRSSNQWVQAVQLVDLFPDRLVARGSIEQSLQPRRAALHANRVLSVTGRELLSVDITDRDQPAVRGRTELSWRVQRVFVEQDFLLEMNEGQSSPYPWYPLYTRRTGMLQERPTIRVASAEHPDVMLATLTLTNLPVLGVTKKDQRLYVLQGVDQPAPGRIVYPMDGVDVLLGPADLSVTSRVAVITNTPQVTNTYAWAMTVIDLSQLPALAVVNQTSGFLGQPIPGGARALWPKPDVLVWVTGNANSSYYSLGYGGILPMDSYGILPSRLTYPGYPRNNGKSLIAFNVEPNRDPALVSVLEIGGTNQWYFHEPITADGLVYMSHEVREPALFRAFIQWPTSEVRVLQSPSDRRVVELSNATVTNTTPPSANNRGPHYFLNVVDYADPVNPTAREPIALPGRLEAVAYEGALLYTLSTVCNSTSNQVCRTVEQLDALGYDGVTVHRVDSLPLPQSYPRVYRFNDANIFLGLGGNDPSSTNRQPASLESWTMPATGKFTLLDRLTLNSPVSDIKPFPGLLAVRQSDRLQLIDISNPADLRVVNEETSNLCLGYTLDRAEGDSRGLWVPLNDFGVGRILAGKQ